MPVRPFKDKKLTSIINNFLLHIMDTHCISIMKTIQLILPREIIIVSSEIRTQHINTICGQN